MENISKIYVKRGVSSKGNEYAMLVIEFVSGYVYQHILTNEQRFALELSLKDNA